MVDKNKDSLFLPLLCTRGAFIFPEQDLSIEIGRPSSVGALLAAAKRDINILVFSQKDATVEKPKQNDLYPVGTICSLRSYRKTEGTYRANFVGIKRAQILEITKKGVVSYARYKVLDDYFIDEEKLVKLFRRALTEFEEITKNFVQNDYNISVVGNRLLRDFDAATLTDTYASLRSRSLDEKAQFMAECNLEDRLELMLVSLERGRREQEIEEAINERVKDSIEENQKEYYLREKLKAIKAELDGDDNFELNDLREKLAKNPYPERVKLKANEEFRRYDMTPSSSAESGIIRSYIETLLSLPWFEKSEDTRDLAYSEKILNEDHYGLEKVKERILEYLAVKEMTGSLKSPILCLVGPPGVGKTSLARSIARALNRNFVKVSLGGVHDEAEIRGHRRTYLGAMPGRIIQGMKKAAVLNPVFLLDEIDKMASDFKGDPSSAMLEVLDPEQNAYFSDNYLEETYDLSDCLFVATANYIENIPIELRDRLEIIQLSSYTEIEKLHIASEHILPKKLAENSLKSSQFVIPEKILLDIIRYYTREAGVRQLERTISSLCRKAVLSILKDKKKKVTVSKKLLQRWLGSEIYDYGSKESEDQIGVVTGLAYTSFGGDILPIEVNYFKGNGKLNITGQLGDVMKESAAIAFDYLKANAQKYQIDFSLFEKNDFHIHVPEGAIPKDGPSAGVTLTTALVSALSHRKVRADIAMTGEVTLRGNVLAIGGLKEKSLAAHRSGIKTIFIPRQNLKDVENIPECVRTDINFIAVDHVEEVIKGALKSE